MDDVYSGLGFIVFWLLVAVIGVYGPVLLWALLADYVTGEIKRYKEGFFLFGWMITTGYGREVYIAKIKRHARPSKPHPASRTVLSREWLAALESRRFSYSFLGLEIFWMYRFLPTAPWRVKSARYEYRRNPATWFPTVNAS